MAQLEKYSPEKLDQLVKEVDLGGREPGGKIGLGLAALAAAWSLFQVWYASPLPFIFGFGILNDTEARAIHLAFAIFLAFCAFPAFNHSSRTIIPWSDWLLALVGAFCGAYLFLFYNQLALRPGSPTTMDIVIGVTGVAVMLEATRRAMGFGMLVTTGLFMAFVFLGPYMPEVLQHRGASLSRFISHMWLTTEGVYGVALGVSVQFIFLFVLFGTLLDIAGAGNYMLQVSLATLGHLRGGPAKVAVVSSALNGIVSGSSVSNVVSGGIFTIPLMKRTGYSGVKAGAIEAASSINGQIMPPVMGAAAFLMVEYVGIPYAEIIKHAALPAVISYVALFYIVHLEALKYDLKPLVRERQPTWRQRVLGWALGLSGTAVAVAAVYYAITAVQAVAGGMAGWALAVLAGAAYIVLMAYSSRYPGIAIDDPLAPDIKLPLPWPTVRAGLHFFIPIVVLLWCLMVEELSPGLSAFWATATVMVMVVLQPFMLSVFRPNATAEVVASSGQAEAMAFALQRQNHVVSALQRGVADLWRGLVLGARNMIGIGVACASAGLIVGVITLTGMGLMMTDFVELVSAGNVLVMLLLTALICLIIGAGVPTTANYILVATLMAPVIVELGGRSGLVIPLIAVHLFVFYFGILADVTPPVGLASYAAAAISGDDPNATGWQATWYSLRTTVLPFVFIFNPQILLIGLGSWVDVVLVCVTGVAASLLFAAATMKWFRTRCTWPEVAMLLLATFLFFRPDWVINQFSPKYVKAPAADIYKVADGLHADEWLVVGIAGQTLDGEPLTKTVALPMGEGATGRERLRDGGVTLSQLGPDLEVAAVKFGSRAKKLGVEQGYKLVELKLPNPARPSSHWVFIPAALLGWLVWWLQGLRLRRGRGLAPA
ncbi:TRAP transporter permease [Polaromonas sp. JS666]|uniref:TRAP transporter permease n=1 Tax=Polaromonas sp. (strain JS666 / ATCC BAA-500) TaxID=296591 RepID=UPI0000464542|nr:TRAP transporter permease [Polaromonas sp. JS666]ABE43935.1 TRAP transporter, 4TM/12TM fusion protein [Polaromonas sp. JS666]